jgi:hypothetical protein
MKIKKQIINLLDSLLKKLKEEDDNPDPEPKKRIYNGKDLWKE